MDGWCWEWRGGGVADYRGTKMKKEKVKILPVDGADTTLWGGQYKIRDKTKKKNLPVDTALQLPT